MLKKHGSLWPYKDNCFMFCLISSKMIHEMNHYIGKLFLGEKYELYRWIETGYKQIAKWNGF